MSNVVAAQVRLLRRKLNALGCQSSAQADCSIETVYGLGYRFNPPVLDV